MLPVEKEGRRKGKRLRTRRRLLVEAGRKLRDGEAEVLSSEGMDDGMAMDWSWRAYVLVFTKNTEEEPAGLSPQRL